MPTVLLRVTCETTSDQLRMKDGWKLESVLNVQRVGHEWHWHLVVSHEVQDCGCPLDEHYGGCERNES